MLQKIDKRVKEQINQKEEFNSNVKSILEIKKSKREEENFHKITFFNLLEKLKEEIFNLKLDIKRLEADGIRYRGLYANEVFQDKIIQDKLNHKNSKINSIKNKIIREKSENNLALNYYNNVIDQKWSFIHAGDERKERQHKLSQRARVDTQDKEEHQKRNVLFLCFIYNKYLRKKMEKEFVKNAPLEETFQTIKYITV